jgi:exopolyphosphatase
MSSLSDVLKRAKDDHESATSTRVVLGNESCDLDSVACTLAMAHLYSVVNPPSVMPLPLLNCQREDFPLRTDIVSLLEELMISPDDLLFFPEVDLKNLPDPSITLVDHNTPPMDYTSLVDEIIDHHQDSESVVTCSRTIELVGSCSTLVAQKLLNRDDYTMTQDVATLLLAAILIDTGDLKAEGRCTHWDVDVSSQLKPLCHIQDLYNRVICTNYLVTILFVRFCTSN